MKRFNEYLLTHYPLLWNTRVAWVLLANAVIHLLFFLSGLASVNVKTLLDYSSVSRVGGEGMYVFSVLCALLVLIVWCVFYLRNNAFKSFYRLSEYYLAKEFGIIFLIVLTSICYSQSFEWGVRLRVRSITSESTMLREMTAVNTGMVYVPVERTAYFILNSCEEKQSRKYHNDEYEVDTAVPEINETYSGIDSVQVRKAMSRPDAFSYANYCRLFLSYTNYSLLSRADFSNRNRLWLQQGRRDSVRQSIHSVFSVFNKYGLDYRLNADSLTAVVFATPFFSVQSTVPQQQFEYRSGVQVEHPFYISTYDINRVFDFIEDCQPSTHNWNDVKSACNVIGYIALSLSILLLCYRRYSRKVFLISVIGILVWSILIGLMTMGGGKNGFAVLLLILCAGFLAGALGLLAQRSSKTAAGVFLNWHSYLMPFVVMLVVLLIDDYHSHQQRYLDGYNYPSDYMRRYFPFSTWVVNHTAEIFLVNILAVGVYVAFVFNRLANRWQLLPQE